MKAKVTKQTVSYEDTSETTIVDIYMEDYYDPAAWEDGVDPFLLDYSESGFWEEFECTDEEKEEIIEEIKKEHLKHVAREKELEKNEFRNRTSILRCIEDCICSDPDYSLLDPEEILELILKNGRITK